MGLRRSSGNTMRADSCAGTTASTGGPTATAGTMIGPPATATGRPEFSAAELSGARESDAALISHLNEPSLLRLVQRALKSDNLTATGGDARRDGCALRRYG